MLAAGTRLGPYEIVAPLGSGGMGEVYRARDGRLGRDVAVKVIRAEMARDPERIKRFEQETRAAGALSHPNVCVILDVGTHQGSPFVVMELLEGGTLRARLDAGPLPFRKAVDFAAQAARGLAAAHAKGIVHRDLKPENLFVTKDGRVEVLDFGLAKLTSPELLAAGDRPESILATETQAILGTAGYMAPEQVRGEPADARADLFALGAILHESLTGRHAFHRASRIETLNAILNDEPEALGPRGDLPAGLEPVVRRCLEKNPDERFQSARDLAFALESLLGAARDRAAGAAAAAPAARAGRVAWALVAAAVVVIAVLGAILLRGPRAGQTAVRFTIDTPAGARNVRWPRISPDARLIAFQADDSAGRRRIWIRQLDSFAASLMPGTENAGRPFWSSDGRWIAYASGNRIFRVLLAGGAAQALGVTPGANDGTWSSRGVILYDGAYADSIQQIPATGGKIAPATRIDRARGELFHAWPVFLPDGKRFLFLAAHSGDQTTVLKWGRLGSLESWEIGPVPTRVEYSSTGHLLYVQNGIVSARRFDLARLRFTGDAFPIAEGAAASGDRADFSVSSSGTLVYGRSTGPVRSVLVWVDRSGRTVSPPGNADSYQNPALSPDGKRVAYEVVNQFLGTSDLWVRDLVRGVSTRVTTDPGSEAWAVWSPDGKRLAYGAYIGPDFGILARAWDGTGPVDTICRAPVAIGPTCWSADRNELLLARVESIYQVWSVPARPGSQPRRVVSSSFSCADPRLSPDGRWLAYSTNETGAYELFVQAYLGQGERLRVSTNGGGVPRWSRDGRTLFYHSPRMELMAVPIRPGKAGLEIGTPVALFAFASPSYSRIPARNSYDVDPDGQKFLVNRVVTDPGDVERGIAVMTGWANQVPRRRP